MRRDRGIWSYDAGDISAVGTSRLFQVGRGLNEFELNEWLRHQVRRRREVSLILIPSGGKPDLQV